MTRQTSSSPSTQELPDLLNDIPIFDPQVMVFDKTVSPVVQLSVIEPYDMMIARVERHRAGEGGKLIVFRLSDLEEFLADLLEWHHHVDTLLHR